MTIYTETGDQDGSDRFPHESDFWTCPQCDQQNSNTSSACLNCSFSKDRDWRIGQEPNDSDET